MKKALIIMFFLQFLSGCENNAIVKAKSFGTKEFDSREWKSSNSSSRSKMIYSFLKKHDIVNMTPSEIYNLLGKSTAYYEYDEFPAYLLQSNQDEYIIAFPIDRKTQKIKKYLFEPELK
ncbi:hypothetical protein JYT31_01500 [Beggiatoa alba]|nr:hypothetical protein [Beggiatoa alba]